MKKIVVCLLASSVIISCKKDCPEPEPEQPVCKTKLDSGLLAYYPFDGNFNDASGNSLHATAKNGAALSTDFLGRAGKSAGFDGSNDYLIVPANTKLNTSEMTVSFQVMVNTAIHEHATVTRINYNDATGATFAMNHSASIGNKWGFATWSAATACTVKTGTEPSSTIMTNSFEAGRWYNVIGTFSNGSQKLYIDGVQAGSAAAPFNALKQCANADLVLGGWWNNNGGASAFLNGKLDEVRLYNRVLTDCEIAKLAEVFKQ
jgi:hypothetical protein